MNGPSIANNGNSSLLSQLPLEPLIRMVASSPDALEGLHALASEIGGRRGAEILHLAKQIERGQLPSNSLLPTSSAVPALQAAVSDAKSMLGHLPRWVLLQNQRDGMRARLRSIVWFFIAYVFAASLVAVGFSYMLENFTSDMWPTYDWFSFTSFKIGQPAVAGPLFFSCIMIAITLLGALWAIRGWMGKPCGSTSGRVNPLANAVEIFWDHVPLVGSTYRSIDLAHFSESIYQALAGDWTYSQAFRSAAAQTKSSRLRAWMNRSANRFDQGSTMNEVMEDCPFRASWLRGISGILATPMSADALVTQWRMISDHLHQLMIGRTLRAIMTIGPFAILLSLAILLFAWGNAMRMILSIVGTIL